MCPQKNRYIKVPGVWTGGHEENARFRSINCSHGPGESEWGAIAGAHVPALRTAVLAHYGIDIYLCEGRWFPDVQFCRAHAIPVLLARQREDDVVVLRGDTVHWVRSVGYSVNTSWNFGTLDAAQLATSFERCAINAAIGYPNIVPMDTLAHDLGSAIYAGVNGGGPGGGSAISWRTADASAASAATASASASASAALLVVDDDGEDEGEGGADEDGDDSAGSRGDGDEQSVVAMASASPVGMARVCARLDRAERLRLLRLLKGVLQCAAERDAGHKAALQQGGFSIRKEPHGALVVLCESPCCQVDITRYYVRCDSCCTLNSEHSEARERGRMRMETVPVYLCVECGLKHCAARQFAHHKAGAFEKRFPALTMSGTAVKLGAMIAGLERGAAREGQSKARERRDAPHGGSGGGGGGSAAAAAAVATRDGDVVHDVDKRIM